MRLAYHSTGASLSATALQAWLDATVAALGSVSSPGVLISVSDPKRPYAWSVADILADDRRTLGGRPYSRLLGSVRAGNMEFNPVGAAEAALWEAWHLATYGGRIPFVVALPIGGEVVAVTSNVDRIAELVSYRRYQITPLSLVEWQG